MDKKIGFIVFTFLTLLTLTFCSKDEGTGEDLLPTQNNTIKDIRSFGGNKRLKFHVWFSTPDAKWLHVLWNNRTDSVVVSVPQLGDDDYLEVMIQDNNNVLTDKNNQFFLYTYDKNGRKSTEKRVQAKVYGAQYRNSLTNKQVKEVVKSGDEELTLAFWKSNVPGETGAEVFYTNTAGEDAFSTFFSEDLESGVTIDGVDVDKSFQYRTIYKPEPEALDLFYSDSAPLLIQDYYYIDLEQANTVDEFVSGVKNGSLYDTYRRREFYLLRANDGVLPMISDEYASKGEKSLKAHINPNTTGTSARSELKIVNDIYFDEERCFAFDVYIDNDFKAGNGNPNNPSDVGGWVIFTQFHQDSRGMPPITLEVEKGSTSNLRYQLFVKNDDTGILASTETRNAGIRYRGNLDRNRWTRFAIRFKASPYGGSLFELYQNGEKMYTGDVDVDKIAFGEPYNPRMEWRVGLYRSSNISHSLTMWFDEVRYGKTLDEVDYKRKP